MRHGDVGHLFPYSNPVGLQLRLRAFRSFWFLQRRGVPFSSLALGFGDWPGLTDGLLYEAQTVYFFTLVIMQWGYVLLEMFRNGDLTGLW